MSRKRITVVLFAVMLVFVLALSLAACVDPTDQPTHNDKVRPYLDEVSELIAGSISADLQNGFNAGFTGRIKAGEDEYSFDLDGNFLSKDVENQKESNKDFRFVLKKGDETLFGLYNDKTNLYLQAGENKYNFENAGVMKALRSFLVLNVEGFTDVTTLDAIKINDTTIKEWVETTLPIALTLLTADPDADATENLMINKTETGYVVNIYMANLGPALDLLGLNVDLSGILGDFANAVIRVQIDAKDGKVSNIGVLAKIADETAEVEIASKNAGLFGAVKDDLDASVPEDLKAVAASSVIQTDFAGKINFMVADENGSKIAKSFDWKFVSKIDLFTLVEENFMLSRLPEGNFFHLQVSHKCNDDCREFCANNLISSSPGSAYAVRSTNTSVFDLAWDPSTMDTDNLVVDISLFDILTRNGLYNLGSKLADMIKDMGDGEALSSIITEVIPSQLTLSLNIDSVARGLQDDTIPYGNSEDVTPPAGGDDADDAGIQLDVMAILKGVIGAVGVNANGNFNVSIDGIKSLLTSILGDENLSETIPLKASDIVTQIFLYSSEIVDEKRVDKSFNDIEFTMEKNNFGHNAVVADYNTYEKAVKYNVDGKEKLALIGSQQAQNAYGTPLIQGSPVLYVKEIETDEGYLNLYAKDGSSYTLVAGKNVTLSHMDLKYKYDGYKNLYFKYTYVDFNKAEKTAYSHVLGFQGFDLNKDVQDVTLLGGMLMGQSFNVAVNENLAPLLQMTLDLETILPMAANTVEGKINFNHFIEKEDVTITDAGEQKFEYRVGESLSLNNKTAKYKVGDREFTMLAEVKHDVKRDTFGQLVPGTYKATWTFDKNGGIVFEDGTNQIVETIVVEEIKDFSLEYVESDWDLIHGLNNKISHPELPNNVFAKITYTLKDDSTFVKELKWNDYASSIKIANHEDPSKVVASKSGITINFLMENAPAGLYDFTMDYTAANGTAGTISFQQTAKAAQREEEGEFTAGKFVDGNGLPLLHKGVEIGANEMPGTIGTGKYYYVGSTKHFDTVTYNWAFVFPRLTVSNKGEQDASSKVSVNTEKQTITFSEAGVYVLRIQVTATQVREIEIEVLDEAKSVTETKNDELLPAKAGTVGGVTKLNGKTLLTIEKVYALVDGTEKTETLTFTWANNYHLLTFTKDGTATKNAIADRDGNITFKSAGVYAMTLNADGKDWTWTITVIAPQEGGGVVWNKIDGKTFTAGDSVTWAFDGISSFDSIVKEQVIYNDDVVPDVEVEIHLGDLMSRATMTYNYIALDFSDSAENVPVNVDYGTYSATLTFEKTGYYYITVKKGASTYQKTVTINA